MHAWTWALVAKTEKLPRPNSSLYVPRVRGWDDTSGTALSVGRPRAARATRARDAREPTRPTRALRVCSSQYGNRCSVQCGGAVDPTSYIAMWSRAAQKDAERDAALSAEAARDVRNPSQNSSGTPDAIDHFMGRVLNPSACHSFRQVRLLKQQLNRMEDDYAALEEKQTRLLAEIKRLQASGQALQANMKAKEKKPLRQAMAQKRKERILLKRQISLLAPPTINDLPYNCLVHVLVTAVQSDDILAYAAVASQVCRQWRNAVMNRDPYARALYDNPIGDRPSGAELQLAVDEMMLDDNKDLVEAGVRGERLLAKRRDRARILSVIRAQTKLDPVKQAIGQFQSVELAGCRLCDEGARAVACALGALPSDSLLSAIILRDNEITKSGFRALGEALAAREFAGRAGMCLLDLGNNPDAGDEGVQDFVTRVFGGLGDRSSDSGSAALLELRLNDVGCGDGGMQTLAMALPSLSNWARVTTKPATLQCGSNPDISDIGWVALGEVLPKLLGLAELDLSGCHGMGDTGMIILAEALTKHSDAGGGLNVLAVDQCGIANQGGLALAHVVRGTPSLLRLSARRNLIDEQMQAAIRAVAKSMRLKLRLKEL